MNLTKTEQLRSAYVEALRPRPFIAMHDWIVQNVVIPDEQPKPGPFRHLVRAADGVMAALENPEVNTVVLRGSVQMMKTTILVNAILYYASENPAQILVYEPDDGLSKKFLTKKLDPIAIQIDDIANGFKGQPTRSRERVFAGGQIDVLSGLAKNPEVSETAKYIFIDEYRKFTNDLYQAIRGRATLYAEDGAKIYATSSAGDHGACRTTQLLEQSDYRQWRIPCNDCGAEQNLVWDSVEWKGDDPDTAVYVCTHCHYHMTGDDLRDMNQMGRWVATKAPDRPGIAGFDCNFMASPFVSLSYGVGEWIAAYRHMRRTGSESQVRQFYQDWLAEPYRPGAGMRPDILSKKCRAVYKAGEAPEWVSNVVLAIDVQDDRLEYEFSGWAAIEVEAEQDAHKIRLDKFQLTPLVFGGKFYQLRRAGLEYGRLVGDPGLNDVWEQLDNLRCERRFHIAGKLPVAASVGMVDSGGHHTGQVKAFVNRVVAEHGAGAARGCAIYGCKGASQAGQPLVRQSPSTDTRLDWGGHFLLLGVDSAKDWCHAMLRASRYARVKDKSTVYPAGKKTAGYDLEYFEGLCAEKKQYVTNRYGHAVIRWVKDEGTPNEPLDIYAYSLAGAHLLGLSRLINDGTRVAKMLAGDDKTKD